MPSSSTVFRTFGRGTEAAGPSLVRTTPPAKSLLTIRLPDLNNRRRGPAAPHSKAPLNSQAGDVPSIESAELIEDALTAQCAKQRLSSPEWLRRLSRKTVDFVRQPKFWLACVVAAAVQVVLAFVMTPAEDVPGGHKQAATSAQPWQKDEEEPAARIVVPAAPVNVPEEHPDSAPAASSPMGPALPIDSTTDTIGHGSEPPAEQPRTADRPDEPFAAARLAEKRAPAADDRRAAIEADGATLGGIAPFDPGVSSEQHEIR